jgi:hypothetical protein
VASAGGASKEASGYPRSVRSGAGGCHRRARGRPSRFQNPKRARASPHNGHAAAERSPSTLGTANASRDAAVEPGYSSPSALATAYETRPRSRATLLRVRWFILVTLALAVALACCGGKAIIEQSSGSGGQGGSSGSGGSGGSPGAGGSSGAGGGGGGPALGGSAGAGGSSAGGESAGAPNDAGGCPLPTGCGTISLDGCVANECVNNGACILLFPKGTPETAPLPKCAFTSCMPICGSNSNCGDGYECVSPRAAPWNAVSAILDNDQSELVCLPEACVSP